MALDALFVGLVNRGRVRQVALLLRALLGQDVTLEGVLPLDLPSPREFEALFGARLGLHFGHFNLFPLLKGPTHCLRKPAGHALFFQARSRR